MEINENAATMATQPHASTEKLDWATRHHGPQDKEPKLIAASSLSLSMLTMLQKDGQQTACIKIFSSKRMYQYHHYDHRL